MFSFQRIVCDAEPADPLCTFILSDTTILVMGHQLARYETYLPKLNCVRLHPRNATVVVTVAVIKSFPLS
jgi:hypothetical protein